MGLLTIGSRGTAVSGAFLALAAVFFWSTNALAAKFALVELSVAQVLFLQFSSASVVILLTRLLPFGAMQQGGQGRRRFSLLSRVVPPLLAMIGIIGTIGFQYLAFANAPIAQANLIAYAWPLLAALWIAVVVRPPGSGLLLGLASVGFLGVGLLIGGPGVVALQWSAAPGYLFAILSACCMAVYTLGVARLSEWRVTAILPALLVGAVAMAALSFARGEALPALWAVSLGIYIGVGPMALGYALWSIAVRRDDAGRVAVLGYLTPVASTFWLILAGEELSTVGWVGAALVLVATTLLGLRGRSDVAAPLKEKP